jgi:hypothetical protein
MLSPAQLASDPLPALSDRLVPANTSNAIIAMVAEFRLSAQWRIDWNRPDINDWAVGFYQATLRIAQQHCYLPLSGPPAEPGTRVVAGSVWVTREEPVAVYELDGRPPRRELRYESRSGLVSSTHLDRPGIRRAPAFREVDARSGSGRRWVQISRSTYAMDFYTEAVVFHLPTRTFLAVWEVRWMINATLEHSNPGGYSPMETRAGSPYQARIIRSTRLQPQGGVDGFVSGLQATPARPSVEGWQSSCPAVC